MTDPEMIYDFLEIKVDIYECKFKIVTNLKSIEKVF
jgi:hypothetical protein